MKATARLRMHIRRAVPVEQKGRRTVMHVAYVPSECGAMLMQGVIRTGILCDLFSLGEEAIDVPTMVMARSVKAQLMFAI
jgi:hypothetical protein